LPKSTAANTTAGGERWANDAQCGRTLTAVAAGSYTGAPCLINNRRVISNDNLKVAYDEGGSVIYYDEEDEPETTHGGG